MKTTLIKIVFVAYLGMLVPLCAFSESNPEKEIETSVQPKSDSKVEITKNEKTEETQKTVSPLRKEIGGKVDEILSILEKKYQEIVEDNTKTKSENAIAAMVRTLGSGLEYRSYPPEKAINEKDTEPKFYRPVIISSQKLLYIRIDGFTSANFASLKEECEDVSRLANAPVGTIFDLRNCSGYSIPNLKNYLTIFSPCLEPSSTNVAKSVLPAMPSVILVGKRTEGDGEIFTSLISGNGKTLVIGEETMGRPFRKLEIILKEGGTILIPEIPIDMKNIKPLSVKPSIAIQAYPQVSFDRLSSELGSEDGDICLRRAADLLICLNAIEIRDKKKD